MKYTVDLGQGTGPILKFDTKRDVRSWIMSGLFGCEGAERDHYVNMLAELEDGRKALHYN